MKRKLFYLLVAIITLVGFLPASVVPASNEPTIDFDTRIDAGGLGPWMFDQDVTPYNYDAAAAVYAYLNLVWNPTGMGNGNIGSGGSGQASFGTCTAENTSVLQNTQNVTIEFNNFVLSSVQKRNWGILGQSGDYRVYTNGTGTIKVNGVTKLQTTNSRISMDVNWPAPIGPGSSINGSGWGTIDPSSDDAWEAEFNNGNGQVEFVFSSFSPVVQNYYGAFASHVTVKRASHREDVQILPINSTGNVTSNQTGIALNVVSFVKGGINNDLNSFMVKRNMADPGGTPPQGIARIIPAQFWELGTVLNSINASVTFDLNNIPSVSNPNLLRILTRQDAQQAWTIINDYTLIDTTYIRANNLTMFNQFGLGVIPGIPPTLTTGNATDITTNSARLNGTLTSLGTAATANVSFQWGLTAGNYTGTTPEVSMNATVPFNYVLTGLSANTTFYFRAKAVGDNTSYGSDKAFTTALAPPPVTAQVNISSFAFLPATLTVPVGATVTWTNNDSVTHTVTSDVALFNSGNLAQGATFSYTFSQNGTFQYHCQLHPSMTGRIIVEGNAVVVLPGDANGDGVINALDITKIERIIIGLDAPTPGADANQDGNINALDVTKVERLIAGLN